MRFAPTEVVSADELEAIHDASLRILAEIGMNFLDAGARERLAAAGASIDGERVRFDPEMVVELIRTCPSEFQLHSWNPAHTLTIGGDHIAFGSVGSPPNFVGLDGVRRPGTREAFRDLLKLCQSFEIVHFPGGYPVEPIDVHWSVRHLEAALDLLTYTDKVPHTYSLGAQRNRDVLEMTRIARQVDDDTLEREPSVFTVVNSSSPLRLDAPMLLGMIELSSRNQVVVMTPFTLSGAMAPVTLAGAVAQQNAEALAGMVFTQVVRPGAPVVYGGFTSNVDMQSGRAGVRHARVRAHGDARRPAGPPLRRAVSLVERQRRQHARRPGRLRERVLAVGRGDGWRQLPDARRRVDGGWTAGVARQVRARRRPAGDGRCAARPDRRRRRHTGARRHP